MEENIIIRINRSSSILITQSHFQYKFGVVNEHEKTIPLSAIKSTKYTPAAINKTATGCNFFAGIFSGLISDYPDPGQAESKFPVLTVEYYPEGNRWPKLLKIEEPDLTREAADKIMGAVRN